MVEVRMDWVVYRVLGLGMAGILFQIPTRRALNMYLSLVSKKKIRSELVSEMLDRKSDNESVNAAPKLIARAHTSLQPETLLST